MAGGGWRHSGLQQFRASCRRLGFLRYRLGELATAGGGEERESFSPVHRPLVKYAPQAQCRTRRARRALRIINASCSPARPMPSLCLFRSEHQTCLFGPPRTTSPTSPPPCGTLLLCSHFHPVLRNTAARLPTAAMGPGSTEMHLAYHCLAPHVHAGRSLTSLGVGLTRAFFDNMAAADSRGHDMTPASGTAIPDCQRAWELPMFIHHPAMTSLSLSAPVMDVMPCDKTCCTLPPGTQRTTHVTPCMSCKQKDHRLR